MSNNNLGPCPLEGCASSDAFNWDTDEQVGYCHSCKGSYPTSKPVKDWASEAYPPKPLEKKVSITQREVSSGTFEGVRGIKPSVAELYGIQLQLDAEGNPVRYAFKYPTNVKYRGYDEKKFWTKERGTLLDLFGPDFNAGSSRLRS